MLSSGGKVRAVVGRAHLHKTETKMKYRWHAEGGARFVGLLAASSNPVPAKQEKGISKKTRGGSTMVAINLRKGEVQEVISAGLCIAGIKKNIYSED